MFKGHFSLRLCKVEADTYVFAEIEDTGVVLPDCAQAQHTSAESSIYISYCPQLQAGCIVIARATLLLEAFKLSLWCSASAYCLEQTLAGTCQLHLSVKTATTAIKNA